ncbi:7373_t:CDS:2, partial [Dentiscutata erythropus]
LTIKWEKIILEEFTTSVMLLTNYKIQNLINEVHKKLTKWIVKQYHKVFLPKFETQRIVRRANRRIRR